MDTEPAGPCAGPPAPCRGAVSRRRPAARLYRPHRPSRAMLEAFMRLLIDNGLLRREAPADEDGFVSETVLVTHHAVVAGRLGLEHGYEIDRCLTLGPCSTRLDGDYDDGAAARARAGLEAGAPPPPPLPAGFDADRFVRPVSGKDAAWLRMAARTISGSAWQRHAEALVEWFARKKEICTEEYCRGVLREMTSPEIGITLDYSARVGEMEWDAMVARFGSDLMGSSAWTAEELAARS